MTSETADKRAGIVFPLVDRYMGIRMEVDLGALRPGRLEVVESPRRLRREQSYGFIHALWWVWLEDRRSAASVPPGAAKAVREGLACAARREDLLDPNVAERLKPAVNATLTGAGLRAVNRVLSDLCFACNASLLRRHYHGDCRRLVDEGVPPAEGIQLPTHCFPDGIAYGIVADGKVVSVAFAHRPGVMEDRIADVGVTTAPAYQRRGYAKTAVSAVVEHVTRVGGEARYGCWPDNVASIATARSVGFVPYGTSLVLSAPAPE
jgi:GNAT superfamily N-acetyltransferase